MILAILLATGVWLFFRAHGLGYTEAWPWWMRVVLGSATMAAAVLSLVLLMNGLGMIGFSHLRAGPSEDPSFQFVMTVYVTSVSCATVLTCLLALVFHIALMRAFLVVGGAAFLLASSGRPWWWFATLRRVGWFASVESDKVIKTILAIAGLVFLLAGVFGTRIRDPEPVSSTTRARTYVV